MQYSCINRQVTIMAIERKKLIQRNTLNTQTSSSTQNTKNTQRMASSEDAQHTQSSEHGEQSSEDTQHGEQSSEDGDEALSTRNTDSQIEQLQNGSSPKIQIVKGKWGGARPNSGPKKGAISRITAELVERLIASNQTPVELMVQLMQDTTRDVAFRLDAAKAVAPYMHAKLSSIEVKGDANNPLHMISSTTRLPKDPQAAADYYKSLLG